MGLHDENGTSRLADKVVVITGASSGLGRELAVRFAREGCHVVLAARRAELLEAAAQACRAAGGTALPVVTDVTREDQMERLVAEAMQLRNRIDVWINNAGVTLFAPIEIGPFAEHQRVIETNVFGPMLAARAVLPIFKRQRFGVMINVGSILSKIGQPFVPSYVISKFALRGLSEALRTELAEEPHVHVCTILPYAMNTPHFQSAANRVGRPARAMAPAQAPEHVAAAIVELAKHPHRERHVPRIAALGLALHWLIPNVTERLLLRTLRKWHFESAPIAQGDGNLFAPKQDESSDPERGGAYGDRPPRVRAPALALWIAAQAALLSSQSALRRLRRLRALWPIAADRRVRT
jgi:NAD(P)-dependent dehydrogenase (short-subunit alcohol dehydrogenase family)